MKISTALVVLLLLAGCTETLARSIVNANKLADRAEEFVGDNLDFRKWVRATCEELIKEEVQELRQAGKREEARKMLFNSYTPLVTFDIAKAATEGDPPDFVAFPLVCGKEWIVDEETGLLEEVHTVAIED